MAHTWTDEKSQYEGEDSCNSHTLSWEESQTIAKRIRKKLYVVTHTVALPAVGSIARQAGAAKRGCVRRGTHKPILVHLLVNINYITIVTIHGDNGKLPASRLEHIGHEGRLMARESVSLLANTPERGSSLEIVGRDAGAKES